jgi:hypothetical protein
VLREFRRVLRSGGRLLISHRTSSGTVGRRKSFTARLQPRRSRRLVGDAWFVIELVASQGGGSRGASFIQRQALRLARFPILCRPGDGGRSPLTAPRGEFRAQGDAAIWTPNAGAD